MSDFLERIEREIRERLVATRAAVLEHELLQAALHALTGAGTEARRAVSRRRGAGASGAQASNTPGAARFAAPRSSSAAASGRGKAAATGKAAARARATGARDEPSAKPRGAQRPSTKSATKARKMTRKRAEQGSVGRGSATVPAGRPRAPRGANRDAVLRVLSERPGVTTRDLAAASGVHGSTLSARLRTLTRRGELEKRTLPGGRPATRSCQAPRPTSKPSRKSPTAPQRPAKHPVPHGPSGR